MRCFRVYRILQILGQNQDRCFAHDMWPSLITIFSTVSIITLPLSVRATEPILMLATSVSWVVFTMMLWGFLDFGSRSYTAAKYFSRESRRSVRHPYLVRLFYSCDHCASFRVQIGPFGFLQKSMVGPVMAVVFESICNLLIVTKE